LDLKLAIPFPVPVLGEAYSSLNNPVLFATLDFFTHVRLIGKPADAPRVPVSSPPLRRALSLALEKVGAHEDLSLVSQFSDRKANDFLATASIISAYRLHESPAELIQALSLPDDRSFLTLSRAMSAVSGGFTVVRRGEGAISLDGGIDAAFHISLRKGRSRVKTSLEGFSRRYPELAQPTWHLVGHIVLEGGRMVREGNPEGLGKLMTMEAGISYALGLLEAKDLNPAYPQDECYASKPIRSEIMTGELILAPRETLPLSNFNRFNPTQEGIVEDAQG
jgi:hypothetical protein